MSKTFRKGFTLIEILIVIVIIGVLAVAVLSAINPIEQVNKARDAGNRSDAAELLNGVERYYATFGEYPWDVTGDTPPADSLEDVVGPPAAGSWEEQLTTVGEMKPEFWDRESITDATGISIRQYDVNLVRVCFTPVSQSFLQTASYDAAGDADTPPSVNVCVPE